MKRCMVCSFLLTVAVVLAGVPARAADNQFAGPLQTQWENIRNLMVKSAEAVPQDKYDYRPVPGVRTFRDLFVHIADENYFFMGTAAE